MKKKKLNYYNSPSDKAVILTDFLLLTFVLIVVAIPLVFVIASSFSSAKAVTLGKVYLWPVEATLDAYKAVFSYPLIWIGYRNSALYAILGTAIQLTVTLLAAYPLSRRDFPFRGVVTILMTITMFFGGGMIPTYLIIRSLGLLDSIWAMILPGAMSVWNVIITRTYIQSNVPNELYEAAVMDNCSDFRYLINIVIPLSVPVIAVNGLMFAVGHWNSFMSALLYLNDLNKYPLQIFLRNILIQDSIADDMLSGTNVASVLERREMQNLLKYALIIVASLPVMILYPFIQRYFIKGMLVGSIKG